MMDRVTVAAKPGEIQIFHLLPKDEHLDVTLLAIMEIMSDVLVHRTKPKSLRANRLAALQEALHRVDETYHGLLPEVFHGKAEHFYKTIEAGINYLLAYQQQEGVEHAVSETEGEDCGSREGHGEGGSGEQSSGNPCSCGDAGSEEAGAGCEEPHH